MKDFLRKLRLIDDLSFDIGLPKHEFVPKLRRIVDYGNGGFISPFEMFSSSRNEYKGIVGNDYFKIRKRPKLFSRNHFTLAEGTIEDLGGKTRIACEINGFNNFILFFYVFITIAYLIFIVTFLFIDEMPFFVLPFILLHAAVMYGLPYIIMRKGVVWMKRDLERDFFFLTR